MWSNNFASFVLGLVPILSPVAYAEAQDHRVVVYYQTTHYNSSGPDVSLLPLIEQSSGIAATHVLISAVHIVDQDGGIRLNDYPPSYPIFDHVWSDAAHLQSKGVKVMAMVGGAAPGSWERLDGDNAKFERYYKPLHDFIGNYNLNGLDLDVEQEMSLAGIIRLIDRLKKDFGNDFIITLAPVGTALTKGGGNLSGFDYFDLEKQRGSSISFYNAQFYFGWGDASSTASYEDIIDDGFPAHKVVMGLLTNPANGNGYVSLDKQAPVLQELVKDNAQFGGVAAWEYFNSLPGGESKPWEWATWMAQHMKVGTSNAGITNGAISGGASTGSINQNRGISTSEQVRRNVRWSYRQVRAVAKSMYKEYIA